MVPQRELTAQDIRETMQTVGQEHLPLAADGYISTSAMLYDVLMKAASEGISIDAACRDLEKSASGNTIRDLLNEQLSVEKLSQHEDEINPVSVMMWYRLIEWTGDLADYSKKVGNRLRLLLAR